MHGFYVKKNYQNNNLTFGYFYQSNNWYLSINQLMKILYNPKSPSTYWNHLVIKYKLKNINITSYIKIIKFISKDNKEHKSKVISINNSIKLLRIFNDNQSIELIKFIKSNYNNLKLEEANFKLSIIISLYKNNNYSLNSIINKIIEIYNKPY